MSAKTNLTINPQRLWDSLMETARFGATPKGGIKRLTVSDEDKLVPATARNGQLDPGEDVNGNTRLDVGNIALITPANATTNAQGYVIVDVIYPQDAAYWLEVILEARAAVQGTEFSRSSTFLLPGLATDFNSATTAPPGPRSPFSVNDCTTNN